MKSRGVHLDQIVHAELTTMLHENGFNLVESVQPNSATFVAKVLYAKLIPIRTSENATETPIADNAKRRPFMTMQVTLFKGKNRLWSQRRILDGDNNHGMPTYTLDELVEDPLKVEHAFREAAAFLIAQMEPGLAGREADAPMPGI